jgi:hypothetical protein
MKPVDWLWADARSVNRLLEILEQRRALGDMAA